MAQRKSNFPIQGKTGDMMDGKGHLKVYRDEHGKITSAYSYDLQIVATVNGTTIGNAAAYSMTTSKHQTKAGARGCGIVIEGRYDPDHHFDGPVPPSDCGDLVRWYEMNKNRADVQIVHNRQPDQAWSTSPYNPDRK